MALFSPLRQLCGRDDQASVEADLAAFLGPRADGFLSWYRERRVRIAAGALKPVLGWSWWAFLSWFPYFWYRRLWLAGFVTLAVPSLAAWLGSLVGENTGGVAFIIPYCISCLTAITLVLNRGALAIAAADEQGLEGEARATFLKRQGGVSIAGGALGTLALLVLLAADLWFQRDLLTQQLQQIKDLRDQLQNQ